MLGLFFGPRNPGSYFPVIPSEARNLALNVFRPLRDSSSPAAPRHDTLIASSHSLHWGEDTRDGPLISRRGIRS